MRWFKIQTILISFLLLYPMLSFASPFLICDPIPAAVGGKYEVWNITTANPDGSVVYSVPAESDGSMKIDLNTSEKGTYNFKIRFISGNVTSPFISCTLQLTLLKYKSVLKSFTSYSITKGWTLKVPPTSSNFIPKIGN